MTQQININNKLKLMVALDLTDMDPILLRYVDFLTQVWNIEHLYFVHNIKRYKIYDIYDDLLEEGINVEDIVNEALTSTVEANYGGKVPHTLLLTSDDYTESILSHLSDEYDIDIFIAGNKRELQGTGALNQKLARMLDAHVLLVPEEAPFHINKVLIPTDFSADSAKCFPVATSLVSPSNGQVQALHVYVIPQFFYPYINVEKAHDKTLAHLKDKVAQFTKRYKISEQVLFRYANREDFSIVEAIELHADKGSFDMIVVSARGGNNITSLFIGSVTNDLLVRNRKMPLLIVR